jgi:hypothetical protein
MLGAFRPTAAVSVGLLWSVSSLRCRAIA